MAKKIPIGEIVEIFLTEVESAMGKEEIVVVSNGFGVVVKHGRDANGIYTEIERANGKREKWHRDSLKLWKTPPGDYEFTREFETLFEISERVSNE